MEEEYRKHKTRASMDSTVIDTPRLPERPRSADDNSSTRAISSPKPPPINTSFVRGGHNDNELEVPSTPIPTIKISSESDHEREHAAMQSHGYDIDRAPSPVPEEDESSPISAIEAGKQNQVPEVRIPDLQTPATAQAPKDGQEQRGEESGHEANGNAEGKGKGKGVVQFDEEDDDQDEANNSFSNKRLCERWLDTLFMTLYEDLRVYTIWRAEISHFKTQHQSYRKSGTEWEILGELAQRLHHKEEAKDAYQRCLDTKFSARAWMKLLEFYADEGDLDRTLNAAIRLTTYQYR